VSVEGEINGLKPTRHRLALLKAIEQPGRVYGEANDIFDKVSGSRVYARVLELIQHDWIEPVPREEQHRDEWSQTRTYYRLTDFGRAAIERGRR